jgi:hypothetical protein
LTRVNQSVFYFQEDLTGINFENNDVNCYDVLEQLVSRFGARLFMAAGRWWVTPFNVYKENGDIWEHNYDKNGGLINNWDGRTYMSSARVLTGGSWQKMPRLKSAFEKYDVMGTVNYWRSNKDLSVEWPIFNVKTGQIVSVSFDIISTFTVPSGYSGNGIFPIFQVEARTGTVAYLVAHFDPLSSLTMMQADPPRTTGSIGDYYIQSDVTWGSGQAVGTHTKRLNINFDVSSSLMVGDFYLKVTCIGYLYQNELSNVPTTGAGGFDKYVHGIPTGFTHTYTYENEIVVKNNPGWYYNNRTYNTLQKIDTANNKGYKYEHIDMVVGSAYDTANPGMEVYDGSSWVPGPLWAWRSKTGGVDISVLTMREILRGQKKPTLVYYGNFIGQGTFEKAIERDGLMYIPAEVTYHANMVEWEGSWFLDEITPGGSIGTGGSTLRRGNFVKNQSPDVAMSPAPSSAAYNYVHQIGALTQTTAMAKGTITTISVTALDYAVILADDFIYLFNPVTGTRQQLRVYTTVAAGDTSIDVSSTTLEYEYPAGSVILMDTQFLLSKTR